MKIRVLDQSGALLKEGTIDQIPTVDSPLDLGDGPIRVIRRVEVTHAQEQTECEVMV